jgi:hypothetical protein
MTQPEEDYPAWAVVLALAGLCLIAAACAGTVWLGFPFTHETDLAAPSEFGPPALETHPIKDYAAWAARQDDLLAGAEGRMPITDAMNAIASRSDAGYGPPRRRP